ncbi:MAG: thioredoxin domain-containing protein [Cytophagales bacterium]|nr:thioredoxin domain-containing protein [Cytophagales bacterium]
MHQDRKPNKLIDQTSPYLLQHAYNPVNWYPWGKEALNKAKQEDKPIIVSIGYSACHWCHVMERESFENEEIAQIMNEHFVCIKVDREERPDVDQIYMDAVHSMGQRGGWPLNVFLTSDALPFYGGTYFPPQNWSKVLLNIAQMYDKNRDKLVSSAKQITEALNSSDIEKYNLIYSDSDYAKEELISFYSIFEKGYDKKNGGFKGAPKFPMPNIYLFLLRYYQIIKLQPVLEHVKFTLDKMALGGIYDQVGGGFARYSTDEVWFAPHFEKMLYDNAQLVSLYAEVYNITKTDLYKNVIYETLEFIEREMLDKEGGFYSALDADSEGEEGKYYVWSQSEIEELLKQDATLFIEYYNVDPKGNWEHDKNILFIKEADTVFAKKHDIKLAELQKKVSDWKKTLLNQRIKRIPPGLDDKILTSWNGLMLKGYIDAYRSFDDEKFLTIALKNAEFLKNKMSKGNKLFHSYKNGKATIDGYLEDYAFVIDAYIALYQATFDETWLKEAKDLADYVIAHFYDEKEGFFFFTADNSEKLIARKKELFDNVIPASNSQMAINLYFLGLLYDNKRYSEVSQKMLAKMKKLITTQPRFLSNWACLYTYQLSPTAEIVIIGKDYIDFRKKFDDHYFPNMLLMGAKSKSNLPLFENRTTVDGKTTIYVCYDKTCKLPVTNVEEAIKQLNSGQ